MNYSSSNGNHRRPLHGLTVMNRNHFHALAARTESAYTAAQSFIANECPVLEQRLKKVALSTAVTVLTFALVVIDWLSAQLEKRDVYRLVTKRAYIRAKLTGVRQLIKIARFNQRYRITATAAKVWNRKGAIATAALDRIFALN